MFPSGARCLSSSIQDSWRHAMLCSHLDQTPRAIYRRLNPVARYPLVTRLMGSNTTPGGVEPGSKNLTANYDDRIVQQLRRFHMVAWDGDMYHPRSFTRYLKPLVQSDWAGLVVAFRLTWQLEPFLDHPQWAGASCTVHRVARHPWATHQSLTMDSVFVAELHSCAPDKVMFVPVDDPALRGRVAYNAASKVQAFPTAGTTESAAFSQAMNRLNSNVSIKCSARHMSVIGGGFMTLDQMQAGVRNGMSCDVYAVSRVDEATGPAEEEGVLDWVYRSSTQSSQPIQLRKHGSSYEASFVPRGCGVDAERIRVHYGDDLDSVIGTAKFKRVVAKMKEGLSIEQSITEAEKPYVTQFGEVGESSWGPAAPNLSAIILQTHHATNVQT